MKNANPLIERDETDFQVERIRPRSRVGSLLGGLAALALALGLVAIFALNAGKGPSGNPGVGGQPVATNTIEPEASPTPPPYDGRSPFPVTVAPNASPTPVPYTTPGGSPIPTFESRPAPTFDPKASPTPVPFDGKTPVPASNNPGATPTPFPATVTAPVGTDAKTLNLYGVENVDVNGLANVPVAFDYKTLPEHMLATNPQVHFYASKNDPNKILDDLNSALGKAGYQIVTPANLVNTSGTLPPGGIYIFARKASQPDLYINLVSIASAAEVSSLSKTAYYSAGIDFENGVNNMRVKGYNNLLLVLSGNNLLQAITGGSDPGAGSPTGTPTPVK